MRRKILKSCVLLSAIISSGLTAHSKEQLTIPRIQSEIKFDGKVDDPCWVNLHPLQMVMQTPTFGNQPTEKSEVMICYDNTFIYVGARLFDSEASKMLVTSRKRDEGSNSNESLTLVFDSFNDKENALVFSTTPSGLRNDLTVLNDAISVNPRTPPFNYSWNTFWDVKTTRDSSGWYLEMRIPFSSMRFKEENGKVIMGLICFRRIAHKNEVDIFPAISPDWGEYSPFRPSKADEAVFEGIRSKKPFYIAPYALTGYQQDYSLNQSAATYEINGSPKLNVGLDAKYGITNNLTLDITVNTDFAQVEADDEEINLTRFSLYFPEKRSFFQERSGIFSFGFEGKSNLFYSRKIGLYKGEQVPILGGARITGMVGKWDIGFLDMQTRFFDPSDPSQNLLPSQNFGVLRLRRQVINSNSYIGGMVTSGLGMDGTYNTSYGVDGIFRFLKNDYLNLKVAQVMSDGASNDPLSLDATRIFLNWRRFTNKGLGYDFTWTRSGKDFKPGIGFQQRNDYSFYLGSLQYGWLPGGSSPLVSHKFELNGEAYVNNPAGDRQSSQTELAYKFTFKAGFNGMIGVVNEYENIDKKFILSEDADVPVGKYHFTQLQTHLHTAASKRLIMNLDGFAGGFYDGNLLSIVLTPQWNIGSLLQLSLAYEYDHVSFPVRNQDFTGNIARFKALFMLNTKLSVSSFIQYNSKENNLATNLRIHYNPREGNDFYIVFNEGRNAERDLEIPRLPGFNNRSVLLKYTYTFIF